MTATKWSAQFSDDMEACNNCATMCCKHCGVLVQHDDKNSATKQIKGSVHRRLKKEEKVVSFVCALAALKLTQYRVALLEQ